MLVGMFVRPAIRGVYWVFAVALVLMGQIVFSEFYRHMWLEGSGTFGAYLDQAMFVAWVGIGLFRAIFDALVIRGSHQIPPSESEKLGRRV